MIITGGHSILTEHSILLENCVTHKQIEEIKKLMGNTYITDDKLLLPICLDDRASVYDVEGDFTIYHFALENDDKDIKYGIYANGLLVETCSISFFKEKSNMFLIE